MTDANPSLASLENDLLVDSSMLAVEGEAVAVDSAESTVGDAALRSMVLADCESDPGVVDRMFHAVDLDASGGLDHSEMRALGFKLGHKWSYGDVSVIFGKCDPDNTGEIELPAFHEWYRAGTEGGGAVTMIGRGVKATVRLTVGVPAQIGGLAISTASSLVMPDTLGMTFEDDSTNPMSPRESPSRTTQAAQPSAAKVMWTGVIEDDYKGQDVEITLPHLMELGAKSKTYLSAQDEEAMLLRPKMEEDPKFVGLYGNSFNYFTPTHPFRKFMFEIVNNPWFEYGTLTAVLVALMALVIDVPGAQLTSAERLFVNALDGFALGFFTLEAAARSFARGFADGPYTYLQRTSFNRLDFLALLLLWVSFFFPDAGMSTLSAALRGLRPLRGLHILPFFDPYVPQIMNALSASMAALSTVGLMMLLFFLIFGTVGIQMFAGVMTRECVPTVSLLSPGINTTSLISVEAVNLFGMKSAECPKSIACAADETCVVKDSAYSETGDGWDAVEYFGFDHMFQASLTMFIIATLDEWAMVSRTLEDSGHATGIWWLCVFMVILLALVGTNLFVATIEHHYHEARFAHNPSEVQQADAVEISEEEAEKRKAARDTQDAVLDAYLTNDVLDDQGWQSDTEVVLRALGEFEETEGQPIKNFPFVPGISPFCRNIVLTKEFDFAVIAVIVTNAGTMACWHYPMDPTLEDVLNIAEYPFVLCFVIEALMKILGIGWSNYHKVPFNTLDFCVAVISMISLFATFFEPGDITAMRGLRLITKITRAMRVARVVDADKVVYIVSTIVGSWREITNICVFIAVLMFTISILGTHLLGSCYLPTGVNGEYQAGYILNVSEIDALERTNFHTVGYAFLANFQMLTGEDWAATMFAHMKGCEHMYNPAFVALFFVSCISLYCFVLYNLFVALILENFLIEEDAKHELQIKTHLASYLQDAKENALVEAAEREWEEVPDYIDSGSNECYNFRKCTIHVRNIPIEIGTEEDLLVTLCQEFPRELFLSSVMQKSDGKHPGWALLTLTSQAKVKVVVNSRIKAGSNALEMGPVGDARRENSRGNFNRIYMEAKDKAQAAIEQVYNNDAANILMVHGIGAGGWDQTDTGKGEYENEDRLVELFSAYGSVTGVRIRHRVDHRLGKPHANSSWALVTMGDKVSADKVLADAPVKLGSSRLVYSRFDPSLLYGSRKVGAWAERHSHTVCCCIKKGGPIQRMCYKIAQDEDFETVTLAAIVLCIVCLALETPKLGEGAMSDALKVFDLGFNIFFMGEAFVKIVAHGWFHYIHDPYNRFDFFIVMVCSIDLVFVLILKINLDALSILRVCRVARILRALRLIQRAGAMKQIVGVIIDCMPMVAATVAISLFVCFIYGVTGVHLFGGKYYSCRGGGLSQEQCIGSAGDGSEDGVSQLAHNFEWGGEGCDLSGLSKLECLAVPAATWENPEYNFDNIAAGLETLFVCTTTEGWIDIMTVAMDAPETAGGAPMKNGNRTTAIAFFVSFLVFGSFFVTNIFVGVLVCFFTQSSGSGVLTEEQQKWVLAKLLTLKSVSYTPKVPDPGSFRNYMYVILQWEYFNLTVSAVILANVTMMATEHFPRSETSDLMYRIGDYTFMGIFTLEMVIRMGATSILRYFKDAWNRLDFILVFFSWFNLVCVLTGLGNPLSIQGFRAFRILRMVSVLKSLDHLNTMFMTILVSMPAIINLASLIVLVLFVYAVAGMHLYGGVALEGSMLSHHENFESTPNAMKLLFEIMTGHEFVRLMDDLRRQDAPFVFVYFISFFSLATFILVNLFMAVVLENFGLNFRAAKFEFSELDVISFQVAWDKVVGRKKICKASQVPAVVKSLGMPFHVIRDIDFWYNRILLDIGIDLNADRSEAEVNFRQVLQSLFSIILTENCLPYGLRQTHLSTLVTQQQHCSARIVQYQFRTFKALKYPPKTYEMFGQLLDLSDPVQRHQYESVVRTMGIIALHHIVRCQKVIGIDRPNRRDKAQSQYQAHNGWLKILEDRVEVTDQASLHQQSAGVPQDYVWFQLVNQEVRYSLDKNLAPQAIFFLGGASVRRVTSMPRKKGFLRGHLTSSELRDQMAKFKREANGAKAKARSKVKGVGKNSAGVSNEESQTDAEDSGESPKDANAQKTDDNLKFQNPLADWDAAESSAPETMTLTEEDGNIKAIFDELDMDGTGRLNSSEVGQMLKMFGSQGTDDEVTTAMIEMGHNPEAEDDFIGFQEFLRWWKSASSVAVALNDTIHSVDDQEALENALELIMYHEPKRTYILQAIPGPRGSAEIERWLQAFEAGVTAEPGPEPMIRDQFSMQALAKCGLVCGRGQSKSKKATDDAILRTESGGVLPSLDPDVPMALETE